jgi:hypothetical protein
VPDDANSLQQGHVRDAATSLTPCGVMTSPFTLEAHFRNFENSVSGFRLDWTLSAQIDQHSIMTLNGTLSSS